MTKLPKGPDTTEEVLEQNEKLQAELDSAGHAIAALEQELAQVKAAFVAQQKNRIRQEQIIEGCQNLADKWATVPDCEYYPVNVLASELQMVLEGGAK